MEVNFLIHCNAKKDLHSFTSNMRKMSEIRPFTVMLLKPILLPKRQQTQHAVAFMQSKPGLENKKPGLPRLDQLQKDVEEFLKEKYGDNAVKAQVDSLGTKETTADPKDEEDLGIEFDLTPEELERYLREYVVCQEDALEILATKVATHFKRMKWERDAGKELPRIPGQIKPNILMIGPTGVGKTYIIKLIADRIGAPFVKGDATKFSETGYVGGDVEDLVRDLVKAAKDSIKAAEYGIVYIDEIDKIAASQGAAGPDVSRTGVQRNLLKLMEETDVDLRVPHDLASQMEAVIETQKTVKAPKKKVNTRNILFIVSGAFSGLDKIVERRLNRKAIGFRDDSERADMTDEEVLDEATTEDLIEYGFESEFIGRLPVLARLQNLDRDGLYQVLTNPYNAVVQGKIRDFAAYDIELSFSDEALHLIAGKAHKERTGARGLTRVVERVLIPFEKRLPSTSIRKLHVTVDMVENPKQVCDDMVFGQSMQHVIEEFEAKTEIKLNVSPAARRWLQEHMEDGKTAGDVLLEKLDGYEHGFKLVKRNSLQITVNLLENPKDYLEDLIKKTFQK